MDLVREVHDQMIDIGGGVLGEHTASLISACARPFQTFDAEPLYPEPYDRAAALFHGIICDHAFVDGNKRTGTMAGVLMLASEGLAIIDESTPLRVALLGEIALATASGELSVAQVTHWMRRIFEP